MWSGGTKWDADPTFAEGLNDTWNKRLFFKAKGQPEGWYVLYSKEAAIPLDDTTNDGRPRGYGPQNLADYRVLVWYPDNASFEKDDYSKAEMVSRARVGFPYEFQKAYLSETRADLSNSAMKYIMQAVKAQGHDPDYHQMFDWNDDETVTDNDGSSLRDFINELLGEGSEYDPDDVLELATDLGLTSRKGAKGVKEARNSLQALLQDEDTDWSMLGTTAARAGWELSSDDEGSTAPGTDDTENMDRLLEKAYDLEERILNLMDKAGVDADDEMFADVDVPEEADFTDAYENEDGELLQEIVSTQESVLRTLSKEVPHDTDGEDVEVLPPGTRTTVNDATAPEDKDSRKPVQSTDHPRPTGDQALNDQDDAEPEQESLSVPADPEDVLNDIASKLVTKNKGKTIEVELPNDIEFTLKRKGRKPDYEYDVIVETWLDDDELEQFLDSVGGTQTKNKKKLKNGWGKRFLTFEQDSDGDWDVGTSALLPLADAVKLVQHFTRIKTGTDSDTEDTSDTRDFDLLEGIEFVDPSKIVPEADLGGGEDDEDEFQGYYDADEWHEALLEMGFEPTSRIRYTQAGKDKKNIIVKIEKIGMEDLAAEGFKQVVVLHGTKKIRVCTGIDELMGVVKSLMPPAKSLTEDKGHDLDDEGEDTGMVVMDDIYLITWDNLTYIALDGDEADATFLTAQGFVWHPDLWQFTFKSKAKGLRALDRIKAGGIQIENEDDVIKLINGRRIKPKPFSEIIRAQQKERKRKVNDMRFSVHLTVDADGDKVLMATRRTNNRKADRTFRKVRWDQESQGYWMPVKSKAEAKRVLKKMHSDGLRLADPTDFEERWEDHFGGKPGVDFSV